MKSFEVISIFSYTLSKLIPKRKNRWIFGAWFGTAVSDNTKSLFDYIQTNYPEIEKIWIVNEPEKHKIDGCKFVKRNSIESLKYILTAKVAVMNQGFGDFCAVNLLGGCYKVQLWHGIAWKKIVKDAMGVKSKLYNTIFDFINHYDLYIAPSEVYKKTVKSAFGAKDDQVLLCGQPRNDLLFNEDFCKNNHERLLVITKQKAKKIIVYMPTFRDNTNEVFSFCQEDITQCLEELAHKFNFIIIEKSHYESYRRTQKYENTHQQFVYTLPTMDAQVLLAGADMLITDYSSCFFDYVVRDKPIIHFAYDYEYYKNKDRGLYYPIEDVSAGSVAYNKEELVEAIRNNLIDPQLEKAKRNYVRDKYVAFESKDNSRNITDQIVRRVGLGES